MSSEYRRYTKVPITDGHKGNSRNIVEGQIEFGGRRYTVDRWIVSRGESSSNRRGSFHELFDKKGRGFLSKQYTHEMHADCLLSDSIRFNRLAYAVTLAASFLSIEWSKFRSTFPDPSLFASISGLEIYAMYSEKIFRY